MPEGVETDLEKLTEKLKEVISKHGDFGRAIEKPIAFGLKSIEVSFVIEDAAGIIDSIEEEVKKIEEVQSFDVLDLRRAL